MYVTRTMIIIAIVTNIMKEKGKSASDLSDRISVQKWSRLRLGKAELRLDMLCDICDMIDLDPSTLMTLLNRGIKAVETESITLTSDNSRDGVVDGPKVKPAVICFLMNRYSIT